VVKVVKGEVEYPVRTTGVGLITLAQVQEERATLAVLAGLAGVAALAVRAGWFIGRLHCPL
jgi:hypothetical protein